MESKKFDLGFLGGGQLARMSIQAAQRMGVRCVSLDPGTDTPASRVAQNLVGKLDDPYSIADLIKVCDHVTIENEFIPSDAIKLAISLAQRKESILTPGLHSIKTIQDKLEQRKALTAAGVPSPRAISLDGDGSFAETHIGFPMVLKARFGGYDGKGTLIVKNHEELIETRSRWMDGTWLAEEYVPFRRELAVMVARSADGVIELDTVETRQIHHVCDTTYPARLWSEPLDTAGVPIAAIKAIDGFGLFGVEMFELETGEILVNEIAPRPHNTGHYTQDWGDLSQFDLHVRLSMGLPIPRPSDGKLRGLAVYMVNLFGIEGANRITPARARALEVEPSARIHWYEKSEARPGRKMGHINLVARHDEPPHTMLPRLERVRQAFYEGWQTL